MKRSHISDALYRKILDSVPVLTVDLVLVHKKRFLLVKRADEPAKGKWWTPGGRVLWGETMEAAVRRKAKAETGISVKVERLLGIADFVWKVSAWGTRSHTPSAFYLVRPLSKAPRVALDKTSRDAQWFDHIPRGSYPELARMLRKAGFKDK